MHRFGKNKRKKEEKDVALDVIFTNPIVSLDEDTDPVSAPSSPTQGRVGRLGKELGKG